MARPRAISRADEFRRHEGRHRGAKTFAVGQCGLGAFELCFAAEIFAGGDVDHLLGDDPGAGKFKLRDHVAVEAAQRLVMRGERFRRMRGADIAVVFRLDVAALIFLDAAALLHPFDARTAEAGVDVDGHGRIGIGAGGVINGKIGLAGAFAQDDLAQGHAQIGRLVRRDKDLARRGQRAGGHGGKRGVGIGANVHGILLLSIIVVPDGPRSGPIRNLDVWNEIPGSR